MVAAVRAAAVVILVEVGILVVVARAQGDHSYPSPTLNTASADAPREMAFFEPACLQIDVLFTGIQLMHVMCIQLW